VELDDIWSELAQQPLIEPFSREVIERCGRFSQFLFRDSEARRHPELQALAFWMRESAVTTLAAEFAQQQPPHTLRTARGVVFHVPPANVDTIFVYSWLLSTLCGNRNILRLSRRASDATDILVRAFAAAAPNAADTWLLRYGHEADITKAISARADVRVIWGGDATVNAVRQAPLAPHARELTFPDRYSFAVLKSDAFLALSDEAVHELIRQSYNDIYWFDQMACSSPHLIAWIGQPVPARVASRRYFEAFQAELARRDPAAIGTRLAKFTHACREAADGNVEYWLDSAGLTVLGSASIDARVRSRQGGGLLWQVSAETLAGLIPFVERRDQTVTYFGFAEEELREWIRSLGHRGVDRIVPIGQALQFDRIWDGNDLLSDLTRLVRVDPPRAR
jgi:hypothetical protein